MKFTLTTILGGFGFGFVCAAEVANDEQLPVKCDDCHLHIYCSYTCRYKDSVPHKSDGFCPVLKSLWARENLLYRDLGTTIDAQDEWYRERFGDEFDGDNHEDLMAGRYSEEPFWKPFLECRGEIVLQLVRHPTSAIAVEKGLTRLLLLKMDTYLVDPYNLDATMVSMLLRDKVGVNQSMLLKKLTVAC